MKAVLIRARRGVMTCLKLKLHNSYPRAIPLVAAMNISSLSLNPFSVSKQTEKYSELET